MALSLRPSDATAGDEFLQVPPQDTSDSYKECDLPEAQLKAFENRPTRFRIKTLASQVESWKQARNELASDRTLWGYGPPPNSEAAHTLANALQAVKTAADAITDTYSAINGYQVPDNAYQPWSREDTSQLVYESLKEGKSIKGIVDSRSAGQLAYRVAKKLLKWKKLNVLLNLAENVDKYKKNDAAWMTYHDEWESQMSQFDSQVQALQQAVQDAESEWQRSVDKGFTRFCAERARISLVNDGPFHADSGQSIRFGVLENDKPPGLRVTKVWGIDVKGHATIVDSGTGQIQYVAPKDFEGRETFRYEVANDQGTTASAEVVVWVKKAEGATLSAEMDSCLKRLNLSAEEREVLAKASAAERASLLSECKNTSGSDDGLTDSKLSDDPVSALISQLAKQEQERDQIRERQRHAASAESAAELAGALATLTQQIQATRDQLKGAGATSHPSSGLWYRGGGTNSCGELRKDGTRECDCFEIWGDATHEEKRIMSCAEHHAHHQAVYEGKVDGYGHETAPH